VRVSTGLRAFSVGYANESRITKVDLADITELKNEKLAVPGLRLLCTLAESHVEENLFACGCPADTSPQHLMLAWHLGPLMYVIYNIKTRAWRPEMLPMEA